MEGIPWNNPKEVVCPCSQIEEGEIDNCTECPYVEKEREEE